MDNPPKILLYGYGNPGRQDDGLGTAFTEAVEAWAAAEQLPGISCDSNYQLQIEDAYEISDKDYVFYVDASQEDIDDFTISPVTPDGEASFTMHSVSPEYVLALCEEMYKKFPQTYLIHIKGYEWEFSAPMTDQAKSNLDKALIFIKPYLKNPTKINYIMQQ